MCSTFNFVSPQITGGKGLVKLKKEHILQTFPNIHDLVGSSVFIAVGVLTESGEKECVFFVCLIF